MLDVGCWMLDVGCWMLDVGCSARKIFARRKDSPPLREEREKTCSGRVVVVSRCAHAPPSGKSFLYLRIFPEESRSCDGHDFDLAERRFVNLGHHRHARGGRDLFRAGLDNVAESRIEI